jgi:hypothetical protein
MAKKWLGRKLVRKNKSANDETEVSRSEENRPAVAREEPKEEEEPQVKEVVDQHCDEDDEEEETQGEGSQGDDIQNRWESFEMRLSQRMRKSTLKKDTVGQEKGLEETVVKSMASRKNPVWSKLMHDLGEYSNPSQEVEVVQEVGIVPSTMDVILDIPRTVSTSSVPFDECGPPKIVSEERVPPKTPRKRRSKRKAGPVVKSKSATAGPAKIVSESDSVVSIESPTPSADSTLSSNTPDSYDEKSMANSGLFTGATEDSGSSMNSFERAVSRFTSMILYYLGEDEFTPPCSTVRCRRPRR